MSLQFGHDVLQHFLPTMDRFSQKEKQVLLRHNCERHKSSISYSRQRRGRCWQTSIFFVFFEIWLCDVLERPTVQENRCCWYFVVQAPMDKSSVTKYKNENNCVLCDNCYNQVSIANFRYSHIHLCFKFFDPFLTLYVYPIHAQAGGRMGGGQFSTRKIFKKFLGGGKIFFLSMSLWLVHVC